MKKYFKLIACGLCAIIFVSRFTTISFAQEDESKEQVAMTLSGVAGMNGVYNHCYNATDINYIPSEIVNNFISGPIQASEELLQVRYEIQPFGVIGSDGRYKITSPTSQRESTCLIASRFPDNTIVQGTGWLINSNHVATAGHLLYRPEYGGWAKHTAVYVAASGGSYKTYKIGYEASVGGDYYNNCASGIDYSWYGVYDD